MNICPNFHNKQVKQEFDELKDIFGEDVAYFLWDKNNGYSLDKAPNGAESILYKSLLDESNGDRKLAFINKAKVYSKNFKDWFGDWLNDKENSSKIIDKNGEPRIMYHYSSLSFDTFSLSFFGLSDQGDLGEGFYLTPTSPKEDSGYFKESYGSIIMPLFINMRNPIVYQSEHLAHDLRTTESIYGIKPTKNPPNGWYTLKKRPYESFKKNLLHLIDVIKFSIEGYEEKLFGSDPDYSNYREKGSIANKMATLQYNNKKEKLSKLEEQLKNLKEDYDINAAFNNKVEEFKKYDGVINGDFEILVPSPNLIKSAINNNGVFSTSNNNIYNSQQSLNGLNLGAYDRLSSIPQSGNIDTLIKYVNNRRQGINSLALKLVFAACRRYFSDHLNSPKYKIVDNAEFAGRYDENTNTILINKSALFRNDAKSFYPEILTIVHEMLHAVTVNALKNDSRIRNQFEKLLLKTKQSLGEEAKDYGLKNIYEFISELSNALFVEKLQLIQYSAKQTLLDRLKSVLKKFYHQLFSSYKDFIGSDTVYSSAIEDLFGIMSYDEDKFDNILDEQTQTLHESIQADTIDKIHSRITLLYNDLYSDYKKQYNKSAAREKRQDEIWQAIQKLRTEEKDQAVSIAINSALSLVGVYMRDPIDLSTIIPASRNTVLGYLQELQNSGFVNITPNLIHDMYLNIIAFYNDLNSTIYEFKDHLNALDSSALDSLDVSIKEINRLWKLALTVVGDKIVDDLVDKYLNYSAEDMQSIKENAKDWLHRNDFNGDLTMFTGLFNYSRQNSAIIRLAFLLILDANSKTTKESQSVQQLLVEAFNKANSIKDDIKTGNWQTFLMERYKSGPKKGLFTGLFRSAVNRGLFKLDLEKFKEDLDNRWLRDYGYTYYTDGVTGETLRSDTDSSIEEEEWIGDTPPMYVQYLLEVEKWMCDHSHRRHGIVYYEERLSKPYDNVTKTGHGLSPKTLVKQSRIQEQINYILQKCTDKESGFAHPERLSQNDKNKLKMWQDLLADLANPFTISGDLKTGEEFLMALELQAWNKWLLDNTDYKTDIDAFNNELQNLYIKLQNGEITINDYNNFVYSNSTYGINPEFLDFVFGGNLSVKDYITSMYQQSMKKLIKTNNGYIKDFNNVVFHDNGDGTVSVPDMWVYAKMADEKNNQRQQSGINFDFVSKYIDFKEVPYTDANGYCLTKDGQSKFDPNNNPSSLEPMTWFEYIANKYVDAVIDGKLKTFSAPGINIDFSVYNNDKAAIKKCILNNILMYTRTYRDKFGRLHQKQVPLTLFTNMVPKVSTFGSLNKPTSQWNPSGRFTNKKSKYFINLYDDKFDPNDRSGVLPDFGKYGDDEFVDFILGGGAKAEYYALLIKTMELQWDKLGIDPSFNRFKLPLIEATGSMRAARLANNPKGVIKNIKENALNVTSDDEAREDDDFVKRGGKWVLKNAPTRFINELDNPNMVNSDLAYTVGQFVYMANNYVNKTSILGVLETLGYNLMSENRDIEHSDTGVRQQERYAKMMKLLFYESNITNESIGKKPTKKNILLLKVFEKLRSLTAMNKLALNIPSMFVGVWDSFTLMPAAAARGDKFGFKEYGKALVLTFPNLFKALANIANPIANCKAVAMMQKDLLVRSNSETYGKIYKNRITKALGLLMMGGYTVGDYAMNMLILRAMYEAYKYYGGSSEIPEGFYTKKQFIRLCSDKGMSKKEALKVLNMSGESLWDAYYFDNGIAKIKPKYEHLQPKDGLLSGAIQQYAALINGNTPKNDQSEFSRNPIHQFFFLMRNFFVRRMEHWFAGSVYDNYVKREEDSIEFQHRGGTTRKIVSHKEKGLTQEEKSNRIGAIDYSTGEENPAVMFNLFRATRTSGVKIRQTLTGVLPKDGGVRKFTQNERKAILEAVVYLLCLGLLTLGWGKYHDYTLRETDKLKPKNLEQSIPTLKNFMDQKVYLKLIDQCWFRVIDSQFLLYNPYQFIDIVKNATVVTSAIDSWSSGAGTMLDLTGLSGHSLDETITSDSKYKYLTRWQRAVLQASGVGNNVMSWATWRGNDKVGRWYYDNTVTGSLYKGFSGKKWKGDKIKSKSTNNSLTGFSIAPPPPPPAPVAPPPPPAAY